MTQAKQGDTVKVHYNLKLKDGRAIVSTASGDPLEFKIGGGEIFPKFEQAVVGMNSGDAKTVEIPADEAYGAYHREMVIVVDRKKLPEDFNPSLGEALQFRHNDGTTITVTVTDVSQETLTLDANHPLAGRDLVFEIQFIDVVLPDSVR
jgi:peptidylprolyl isomerase